MVRIGLLNVDGCSTSENELVVIRGMFIESRMLYCVRQKTGKGEHEFGCVRRGKRKGKWHY